MNKLLLSAILGALQYASAQNCFADPAIEAEFASIIAGEDGTAGDTIDIAGSCCQEQVCALPCPKEVPRPPPGYGIALFVAVIGFCLIGLASVLVIKGKSENFFVAGRSLPLWVVTATLASQSIDANALLGNVTLSYKFHFWDGACLPLGLGLSLILNAIFLASHINGDHALTLPDVFGKRYGKLVEVMASCCCITSFIFLLAGNLAGMGVIINFIVFDDTQESPWWSIAISTVLILAYTCAGGLFSVAYTDCVQAVVGWTGCCVLAFYLIDKHKEGNAPPPSIGFDGYMYPDEETCQMYDGVPCSIEETACCYNAAKWCPDPENDPENCVADNGAYPYGDQRVFSNQMTEAGSLYPFPNAVIFNWATIFVLAFGNLAALDFQARCMASKTPKIATIGCAIAGCLTFVVGIPWSYLGAITRLYYGPDSSRASFKTDSCQTALGLPTCALWQPDENAFVKLLVNEVPAGLGGWAMIGIVAASMSTCDGAILAMGTVFSHNILRNLPHIFKTKFWSKDMINEQNLLFWARFMSVPFAIGAMIVAMFAKPRHSLGVGYLLVQAFDVVLASVVVPLFGCFYAKNPSPLAGLCSVMTGIVVRVTLEYTLPKDGFVIAPFPGDEFLDYGSAASTLLPGFFDAPSSEHWDPHGPEECEAPRFEDWTGVDSLAAPIAALVAFLTIQYLERNGPLYNFDPDGILAPYMKDFQEREWMFQQSQREISVDASEKNAKALSEVDSTKKVVSEVDEAVKVDTSVKPAGDQQETASSDSKAEVPQAATEDN